MEVRIELRNKRNDIFDRLIEIRKAQADLEAQIGALDQVIAIYEPNYVPARALIGHKAPTNVRKHLRRLRSTCSWAASSRPIQFLKSCGKQPHPFRPLNVP